jgi:hypothetical protein
MNGEGTVCQLANIMGTWNLTMLYGFAGSGGPVASLTMDQAGNLYGTTNQDGAHGYGSVF